MGAVSLQEFLLKFRSEERRIFLPNTSERENDVEHSYFLAMVGWYLAPKIDASLDTEKVLRYALVHDIVEVYAKDTFAFDHASKKDKAERERKSLEQIKSEWAGFSGMVESIDDYEAKADPESQFIYALDKLMPAIMGCLDEGRTWVHEKLTLKEVEEYDRQRTAGYPPIAGFVDAIYGHLAEHPEYFYQPDP